MVKGEPHAVSNESGAQMAFDSGAGGQLPLLLWTGPAQAQQQSGSGFGGMSSGGQGGGSIGGSFGGSSSSGSSSGGSFGGAFGSSSSGSSGGSFTGGNASFGGGLSTTTGSSFRTTTGAGAASTGVTTYSVSPSNSLGTYYGNPTAMGAPGLTGQSNFGQPVYNINSTTSGSGASGIMGNFSGGSSGMQGGISSATGVSFAPSSSGQRTVAYVTAMSFPRSPQVFSGKVLGEVRQIIARSSALSSRDKIRVSMAGDTVILQGSVSDDHERNLAAALVSLTPGVHDVRNELKVQRAPFTPTTP